MSDILTNFVSARKKLLDVFKCKDDFPIKVFLEHRWNITDQEGVIFVNYYIDNVERNSAVVVKKSGSPLIYKYASYTMVIAIDCIKFAYIFKNELKDCE